MPRSLNTEPSGNAGIERYFSYPWSGLKPYKEGAFTYKPGVRPLTPEDLTTITGKHLIVGGISRLVLNRELVREMNRPYLDSDVITVVLDGRVNVYNQGFIGDMIEASRMVTALRKQGKEVRIVTSHTDIFEGSVDSGISIVPIPADTPSAAETQWEPRLRRLIGRVAEGYPVLAPLNARLPILLSIDSEGEIVNGENISTLNRILNQREDGFGIEPNKWMNRGLHQLQALQVTADLVGMEGVFEWEGFPSTFLHPDNHARKVALDTILRYKCMQSSLNSGKFPLLIHPGIATNGRKMEQKFYPESRWRRVLDGLTDAEDLHIGNITIVRPVDNFQSGMAFKLVRYSEDELRSIKTFGLPEAELKQKEGWSLGAFIALLQEFKYRKGIIIGCDSMPAGHAAPALGIPSIVLGSPRYNPGFYCPPDNALVVMPPNAKPWPATKDINPAHIVAALKGMVSELTEFSV